MIQLKLDRKKDLLIKIAKITDNQGVYSWKGYGQVKV